MSHITQSLGIQQELFYKVWWLRGFRLTKEKINLSDHSKRKVHSTYLQNFEKSFKVKINPAVNVMFKEKSKKS